jgi:hypothetical protein
VRVDRSLLSGPPCCHCAVLPASRKPGVANPWLPVERMRSTLGGCGQNFLRYRLPATRRKPVICLPWQIPFDVSVSPVFCTPRKTNFDPLEVRNCLRNAQDSIAMSLKRRNRAPKGPVRR